MAQFDLKQANVYIEDGYSLAGAVNNVAGYAAGASTMLVDSFGANIAVETGDRVRFAGHDTDYVITAHSETSGTTTSITVTPVLADALVDNEVVNILGHQLEVVVGEGNITYDEKRNMEYKKNRGKLNTVRKGDEEPMDVKFDIEWENITSSTGDAPTMEEVLKKKGNASTWISSDPDTCQPYAVNIRIKYAPECEDVEGEEILLPDFRWEQLSHDAKAGTISCTGKCNAEEAVAVRVDAA